MSLTELFRRFSERLQDGASVRSVYGAPITVAGRTVVPVARVGYGFGAGAGGRAQQAEAEQPDVPGGGGGGGMGAVPAGALEITAEGTRFIPFADYKILGAALGIGFLVGLTVGRKLAR
ncbi:spore germination protein GerW family protein [Gloeobacter violaceus]|uniref:Gll3345 protein n=1 Tax=Gloeobacter violaceus (strain ATCC 29082 / PCC 7421) TaxID=251221 RepID=Q7NG28_GLOVI|nr:spore germination protein GerW family protein [Gloeobacter violaceus]BAC91286.1 gll3345 [Gloeobacter violaceus PCC 7421]